MAKFYTYILQSIPKLRYYIGSCADTSTRLDKHNKRQVRATKYGVPWKIVYTEEFDSRQAAFRREQEIKSYKGGIAFKKLLRTI